jgi:ubiquinone/menaquinone biosynthesis C-methylase UbiE
MRSRFGQLLQIVKSIPAIGKDSQSFIGAKWLIYLLRVCPKSKKRALALRILSLSPHYFYRNIKPEYSKLSFCEFLEAEYTRNKVSREKICSLLLRPYLAKNMVVMDYGCGPGFLAKAVSSIAGKVYAVDISHGVLECAKILNSGDNIEYLYAGRGGVSIIPDNGLDIIYSIAVIQHLANKVFEEVLSTWREKLKPGGKALLHIVIDDPNWKSEEQWKADTSLRGKIKLKYALNCFSRTSEYLYGVLPQKGFRILSLQKIEDICGEYFDDVCGQHLLIAEKEKNVTIK